MPLCALLALTLVQAAVPSAPGAPARPATATAAPTRTIVGEIVSIDAEHGLVVVGRPGTAAHESTPARPGESVTVTLDATTQIVKGKRPALLSELKAKDHAVVRYQLTPKGARALSVRVADLLVRTPPPSATPSPIPGAASGAAPASSSTVAPAIVTSGASHK